jgi:hypothetical protein
MAAVVGGVRPVGERNAFAKHILGKWVKAPAGIKGSAGEGIAGTNGENGRTLAGKAPLHIGGDEVDVMIHATPFDRH